MEIPDMFLCIGYVSRHVQCFKGFGSNLLMLELFKDKALGRISVLHHIHHGNRPISSVFSANIQARFPLDDKWRYLAITLQRYLTIILKTSPIRFKYIKSEFWGSFDIMSNSAGKDILFLQLVVLFKMKMKKRRKRKKLSTRIIS